jgi:hypothetical protein
MSSIEKGLEILKPLVYIEVENDELKLQEFPDFDPIVYCRLVNQVYKTKCVQPTSEGHA